jgi:uncharacterized protein YjcR
MAERYSQEIKEAAKRLYIRGCTVADIERETGVPNRTLYKWIEGGNWETFCPPDTVEMALARRINYLAELPDITPAQLDTLIRLTESFGKLQKDQAEALKLKSEAEAIAAGKPIFMPWNVPGEVGYSEQRAQKAERVGKKREREKKTKNDVSNITEEMLDKVRNELFYAYQKLWWDHRDDRTRIILKSRQIGATFYFAFEAFNKAIITGKNQIFLSASRDQAEVFKAYIIAFALKYFDLELKGTNVILLSNGAELRFLSTNSNTAQSYHGDLYIDEFFWIPKFKKLRKVASGMAAQKPWKTTLFSTPSATSHEAYDEWCGNDFNRGKPDNKKIEFDTSHDNLKNGWYGPDRKWRHMVTVKDAEAMGCDLFDIEELQLEYSEDDFANLFMCKFIDDSKSVFSLQKLLDCQAANDDWPDYDENAARPFQNKPVSLGYDPSRVRDNASLAILAVPLKAGDKWRALRNKSYHGQNFSYQANRIKEIRDAHNVVHLGIDTTGIGYGVYEKVIDFYPQATPIHYSMDMKNQLVVKALDVINTGRFQYLAGDNEITRAFLMITKTTTNSGQITYASSRNVEAGHADIAWAIMHALIYEPINNDGRKTTAVFSKAA